MHARFEFGEPASNRMSLSIQMQNAGSSAMNNQSPDIPISSLANPKKRLLAARRMLGWNDTKPCCHIPRFAELLTIPSCSDKSSGTQRSNAWN